jgi:hypothetical protein
MSEVWLRVGIVAGGALLVVLVAVVLRRPGPPETGEAGGLGPGVYFFSSSTCADCVPARASLVEQLGPSGFAEVRWESEPGLFAELGVDAVPCTLIVSEAGEATRFPGLPDGALEGLDP